MPSGRDLIVQYLMQHLKEWVHNQALRDFAGVNDTPRVIRQLRQEGWQIAVRGDGFNRLMSSEKMPAKGRRIAISRKARFEILARSGYRCQACGKGVSDGAKLQVDHIIPVDWGGTSDASNLQALCEECNAGKKAWITGTPSRTMEEILNKPTVEGRIEALFDAFQNEDLSSSLIQLVSKGAFDWQRALRRIRQRTGKRILPTTSRQGYRYVRE